MISINEEKEETYLGSPSPCFTIWTEFEGYRIVNGEIVGGANKQKHSPKNSVVVKSVKRVPKTQNAPMAPKTPKKYVMSENLQKKLDKLGDPLAMMTRYERAQKYEAANQDEKYEYGLSDW